MGKGGKWAPTSAIGAVSIFRFGGLLPVWTGVLLDARHRGDAPERMRNDMAKFDFGYANTDYRPLARSTSFSRAVIDEEIAYQARATDYAAACSQARVAKWARRFPWIGRYVAAKKTAT